MWVDNCCGLTFGVEGAKARFEVVASKSAFIVSYAPAMNPGLLAPSRIPAIMLCND
jgi:hypothetical protein